MKGSILSRWSRRPRLLQPTTMMFALLFVLQACASKGGQATAAPEPKSKPVAEPKQVADAKPSKDKDAKPAPEPVKPVEPAKPAAPPAPPPPPPPTDSSAVAAALCKTITDGAQAAIQADSAPDVSAVVRKITGNIADSSAAIALAKGATCR